MPTDITYFGLTSSRFVHQRDSGTGAIRGIDGYRPRPSHEVEEHDRVPRDKRLCSRCARVAAARSDQEE